MGIFSKLDMITENKIYKWTSLAFVIATLPVLWIVMEEYSKYLFFPGVTVITLITYFIQSINLQSSMSPDRWTEFEFYKRTTISKNAAIYRFKLQNPNECLNTPVGYHIAIKVNLNGEEKIRYYTPTSPRNLKGYFDLIVKSYADGSVSKYFKGLKKGDKLEFKGPSGAFHFEENNCTELGLVAGGSGITPVLQVLNEIVSSPEELTKVSLIYANETEDDILLKKELDGMNKKYPQFQVHYILHHPSKHWKGGVGYITKKQMEDYLPQSADDHRLLICGPVAMNEMVLRYARELGWNNGFQKSKGQEKVFVF